MRAFPIFSLFLLLALILAPLPEAEAQVAHLIPSEAVAGKDTKQISILLAFGYPFAQRGIDMERPQMLAAIRLPLVPAPAAPAGTEQKGEAKTERTDLLGDLEEISYLDKKAWAVNLPVAGSGIYQLVMETRPFWDEDAGIFTQQFVKTIFPAQSSGEGWETPSGLKMEIIPMSRPYGLLYPAVFGGRVELNGKPMPGALVKLEKLNVEKRAVPNIYYENDFVRADSGGNFYSLCSSTGWWSISATAFADPLKGPDGQQKPVKIKAVLWLHVSDGKVVSKPKK